MSANGKWSSVLAAFLLSAITLGTFFVLRSYGPESAIQRFHSSALAMDQRDLSRVTDRNVLALVSYVRAAAEKGAHPVVKNVDRKPGEVTIWISYTLPSGEELQPIGWVAQRGLDSVWRVNAALTLSRRPWLDPTF